MPTAVTVYPIPIALPGGPRGEERVSVQKGAIPLVRYVIRLVGPVCLAALAGCATNYERVAKDWCDVIRASQMIPVYPLSEDIQPGDVFLVRRTIHDQHEEYRDKGYLPFDHQVARLGNLSYKEFYGKTYWDAAFDPGTAGHPRLGWKRGGESAVEIVEAPAAAFPSYSFRTDRGSGFTLAIPVKGVPLAMGLIQANSAFVTVTIDKAHTYACPREEALRALYDWWYSAEDPWVKAELENLPRENDSKEKKTERYKLYLRAVTRVYLTKKVNVSLAKVNLFGTGADVGAPKQVVLPEIKDPESAENYKAVLKALSASVHGEESVETLKPGGSFRFVQASGTSITLEEEFERPLVVGYLGFDVPLIGKPGQLKLGYPIATRWALETPVKEVEKGLSFKLLDRYWLVVGMLRRHFDLLGPQDGVGLIAELVQKLRDAEKDEATNRRMFKGTLEEVALFKDADDPDRQSLEVLNAFLEDANFYASDPAQRNARLGRLYRFLKQAAEGGR